MGTTATGLFVQKGPSAMSSSLGAVTVDFGYGVGQTMDK